MGVLRDSRKFSGHAPIYRAHRAVIFATAHFSCTNYTIARRQTTEQTLTIRRRRKKDTTIYEIRNTLQYYVCRMFIRHPIASPDNNYRTVYIGIITYATNRTKIIRLVIFALEEADQQQYVHSTHGVRTSPPPDKSPLVTK